jgi:hypothetical protein
MHERWGGRDYWAHFTTRTVASAETVYVDPSALLKLYLKEPESRAMTVAQQNRRPNDRNAP